MAAPPLTPDQLRELLNTLKQATRALESQNANVLAGDLPGAFESQVALETLDRIRDQSALLERVIGGAEASASTPPATQPKPQHLPLKEAEEDEWGPIRTVHLQQFYIHYWVIVSHDRINFWVFYWANNELPRASASKLLDTAIPHLGLGYYSLADDNTVPPGKSLLYRESQGVHWDWDSGRQEQRESIKEGQALVREIKQPDWGTGAEAYGPKEAVFWVGRQRSAP